MTVEEAIAVLSHDAYSDGKEWSVRSHKAKVAQMAIEALKRIDNANSCIGCVNSKDGMPITVLSPKEYERDKVFRDRHYNLCKNGSRFIYDLQGTGIGTIVKIKCPICGIEEDITDIESW